MACQDLTFKPYVYIIYKLEFKRLIIAIITFHFNRPFGVRSFVPVRRITRYSTLLIITI